MATLDLSFISVLKVMPAVVGVLVPQGGQLVVLIKPQFEAGRSQVSAGGVVKDPAVSCLLRQPRSRLQKLRQRLSGAARRRGRQESCPPLTPEPRAAPHHCA
jgi:predicted rRNA methylase YqxC with S4 and FtsJ domains